MRTSKKQIDDGMKLNGWIICSKCTSINSLRFSIDGTVYTKQEYISTVKKWEDEMSEEGENDD